MSLVDIPHAVMRSPAIKAKLRNFAVTDLRIAEAREQARSAEDQFKAEHGDDASREAELAHCKADVVYWLDRWGWTFDPRLIGKFGGAFLRFHPWPKQVELLHWLEARFEANEPGIIEKSRDQGVTYIVMAFYMHRWLFFDGFKASCTSMTEDKVDLLNDPDSMFEKLRIMLRRLPVWMLPNGFSWHHHDLSMRLINPANGAIITGEAGDNAGRSGRSAIYTVDEAAFMANPAAVESALSGNTDCVIWMSSVNPQGGMGNFFARKRHSDSFRPEQIFQMHWRAQPLDAKILTPFGWKLMGSVRTGDSVIGQDGKAKTVLGVFPQGLKDVYRVQFSDGSFTESCLDHLWDVIPDGNQRAERKHITKTMRLEDIAANYKETDRRGFNKHRYQIPMASAVQFAPVDLPLDPYVLGCLLGDGSMPASRRGHVILSLGQPDAEIASLVAERLPHGHYVRHDAPIHYRIAAGREHLGGPQGRGQHSPFKNILRSLGLCGTESHTKFIPDLYSLASPDARLKLLQGLLDTDGHACKSNPGAAVLTTVSEKLASDAMFLTQTLGGVAIIRNIPAGSRQFPGGRTHECRRGYHVEIRLPDQLSPFLMSRKANAYRVASRHKVHRNIVDVRRVGPKETQCIKVDGGLYLTDNCIVTHNSDPRKNDAWASAKKLSLSDPTIWEAEFEINYTAAAEGICIPSAWVQAAQRVANLELRLHKMNARGRRIAGVDVGAGKAKSVYVDRLGPMVGTPQSRGDPDTTGTAHWALDLAKVRGATVLNYDAAGPGIGVTSTFASVDREGLLIVPVSTGDGPTEHEWPDERTSAEIFRNLRAELWWMARGRFQRTYEHVLWLEKKEGGVEHPVGELIALPAARGEAAVLAAQLSLLKWSKNDTGKIVIESKDALKKRNIPSPDYADALVMTLLEPDDDEALGIFKRNWFRMWPAFKDEPRTVPRTLPDFQFVLVSLRTAFDDERRMEHRGIEPTACGVYGVFNVQQQFDDKERRAFGIIIPADGPKTPRYAALLCDFWYEKLSFQDVADRVRETYRQKWGPKGLGKRPDVVIVEETTTDRSMRQTLTEYGVPAWPLARDQSRTMRAHQAAGFVQQGSVFVPESRRVERKNFVCDWAEPMVKQACSFSGRGSIEATSGLDQLTSAILYLAMRDTIKAVPTRRAMPDADEEEEKLQKEAMRQRDREKRGKDPWYG